MKSNSPYSYTVPGVCLWVKRITPLFLMLPLSNSKTESQHWQTGSGSPKAQHLEIIPFESHELISVRRRLLRHINASYPKYLNTNQQNPKNMTTPAQNIHLSCFARLSTMRIVSPLTPSVFATLYSLRCVPFNISR